MSQKTPRRSRRPTNDEEPTTFKAPTPKPNGTEESSLEEKEKEETAPPPLQSEKALNEEGEEEEEEEEEEVAKETKEKEVTENSILTRSRSTTPQVKNLTNGLEDAEEKKEDMNISGNNIEESMEPLLVTDEPDPELEFEENSDVESVQESPVLSRCITRRSENRNIPTPKTPKSTAEEDTPRDTPTLEEGQNEGEDLNVTFESCLDNVSTKVEVGGDSTRLDYMEKDVSSLEMNSFLQSAKNKSFGEALRHLSTRRTIRPISDEYRRRLLKNNLEREDASKAYPSRNSVERVSLKRKSSEEIDGYKKRFKGDSPGLFARFTSPLTNIRNPFRSDIPSSTPKLTGYKDDNFLIEEDGSKMYEVNDGERRWCSIM